jgi:predicted RNA-binding Zn-ribbon protein involved in translation (DUF1610 family)
MSASDNYPPGGIYSTKTTVEFTCPECGNTWEAEGVNELGTTELDNENLWSCPECGAEGKYL